MSKFKAGDQVYWKNTQGEPRYNVVSEVTKGDVWFQSGGWMPEDEVFFVEEPEALPEVPEEVRYECGYHPGKDYLLVKPVAFEREHNEDDSELEHQLQLTVKDSGKFARVNLSSESALALSADLLRMGLALKRKEDE